ncbi:MAG: hypothetical protein JNL38_11360 [Myxococcales bacterium]|nr:hypothetical protein [Myxococcales bacterium]
MRRTTLWIACISALGAFATGSFVGGCSSESAATTSSGQTNDVLSPCDTCHTQDRSKRLAGGARLADKEQTTSAGRATLYAPNLTPDNDTGIGSWTDDQLKFAIRDGVGKDGLTLCPPMQHYTGLSDEKLKEIITAMRRLPAVKNDVQRSKCPPIK